MGLIGGIGRGSGSKAVNMSFRSMNGITYADNITYFLRPVAQNPPSTTDEGYASILLNGKLVMASILFRLTVASSSEGIILGVRMKPKEMIGMSSSGFSEKIITNKLVMSGNARTELFDCSIPVKRGDYILPFIRIPVLATNPTVVVPELNLFFQGENE